jgi:hypothetical protein
MEFRVMDHLRAFTIRIVNANEQILRLPCEISLITAIMKALLIGIVAHLKVTFSVVSSKKRRYWLGKGREVAVTKPRWYQYTSCLYHIVLTYSLDSVI